MEEIPNEYSTQPWAVNTPWYLVTTSKGRIKVGWRKRVIQIDWSDAPIDKDGEKLFIAEDVTKGTSFIHAWDYDRAQ
jgi:hypothetical protein